MPRDGTAGTVRDHTARDHTVWVTADGVVPDGTKDHLYDVARRLGVRGRSSMSRGELVTAIEKATRRR